ncbi:HAD domain-containing protein [Kribbella sp. NPDC006257]|uniref:HAD domain-containing protein n=1 Tax=Kribbella sp. NPDC006257 TaxID=3156738 RepID=UPI00339F843F
MQTRPLLLLDIDGPLNPYRAKEIPPGYELHEIQEGDKKWTLLLNQQHGIELNALAETFDLVWATSWEHGANRLIAPRLGLPDTLPVITWPADARTGALRLRRSWKTSSVADWVGGRPFAWVDDEVNRRDRAYLRSRDGLGPHLLQRVEADRGLTEKDFETIREWAR